MHTTQIQGNAYSLPTRWEEVSVSAFIACQKIEDQLLPLLQQMQQVKARHEALLQEIEALFFSKDELAALDLASKNTEAEELANRFADLQAEYDKLSLQRISAISGIPQQELLQMQLSDVEFLQSLIGLLYEEPFLTQEPEFESEGVWVFKATHSARPNIKTKYYCRHLAEYPACIHQVYHALLKKIRTLTDDARLERTEAELELAALFLMPRPAGMIYLITGEKPDKIDFDSGRFNEQLQDFWNRQKNEIAKLPITFLKGVMGFFLPHWQSFFKSQNQLPTTATGTAMS